MSAGKSGFSRLNPRNGIRAKKRLAPQDYSSSVPIPKSRRESGKPTPGVIDSNGPGLQCTLDDAELKQLAIDALRHFAKHGDTRGLTNLVNSIAHRPRRDAFILWCAKHGSLSWDANSKNFRKLKRAHHAISIAKALADPPCLPPDPHRAERIREALHAQAVAALRHALAHGDTRRISALVTSVPGERTHDQLRAWFEQFGAFGAESGQLFFRSQGHMSEQGLTLAVQTPYFKMRRAKQPIEDRPAVVAGNTVLCKVCGQWAMPGEDICFRDQSE